MKKIMVQLLSMLAMTSAIYVFPAVTLAQTSASGSVAGCNDQIFIFDVNVNGATEDQAQQACQGQGAAYVATLEGDIDGEPEGLAIPACEALCASLELEYLGTTVVGHYACNPTPNPSGRGFQATFQAKVKCHCGD